MLPNDQGVIVSFAVDEPRGCEVLMPIVTSDGAWYEAHYRYEKRGTKWYAILARIDEIMPAITPQASRLDEHCRVHMMSDGAFDFELEAEQRRREWADINAAH